MEPGTGLAVLGSAIGGKEIIEKMLGPTADYIGEGLRSWAEKRVENTARIFNKAAAKLGDRIEVSGSVSPKVLKEVLDEGSYCDDELSAEYFGGVLASARSGSSRDDRAAFYLKLTSELSSYQIRFHYLAYLAWRSAFSGSGLRPTFAADLNKMHIFLPASFLISGMDFSRSEPVPQILQHCVSGLQKHSLITNCGSGDKDHLNGICKRHAWKEVSDQGLIITPTGFGIEYWLWAVGVGSTENTSRFLEEDLHIGNLPDLLLPDGVEILCAK